MNISNYENTCAAPCGDTHTLKAMLQHANEAITFATDRSKSQIQSDRKLSLALVRLLAMIGNAASATPSALQRQYSDIPWSEIAEWPQKFNEHYQTIDFDFVCDILRIDLPPLVQQLSCIVGDGLTNGITRSLIQQHPHPSGPACVYSWEYFLEHDEEGLAELPIGLQRLVAVQKLDGGVGNAGFRAFFGNRTDVTGLNVEASVQHGIDALNEFGASDSARIATTALSEWTARLPQWQSAMERGDDPDFESYETFSWPLDKQWYAQQSAMYAAIDAYIKAHPDEFVHP